MKRKEIIFRTFIKICFFIFLSKQVFCKGYKIEVKVKDLKDTTVILGHFSDNSMFPDDTVWVDGNGKGMITGTKKLPGGVYFLVLPNYKWFDFILDEEQNVRFEFDTTMEINRIKVFDSEINQIFFKYKTFSISKNKRAAELNAKIESINSKKQKQKIKEEITQFHNEFLTYSDEIIETNKDNFLGVLLAAQVKEIKVPDPPKDKNGNILDSTFQYHYYRNHYFDHFDISDERLLRTPFYNNKLIYYLDKVIPQIPDTIIKEVDYIIEKSEHDSDLFRSNLFSLFNHYGKSKLMGMETVQIHIADKYYIKRSWWSSEKYIADLKERVAAMKPTLIGNIAPNIQLRYVPSEHFKLAANNDSLRSYPHVGTFFNINDIESEYTVLFFWDPTCSHCKKAVSKLYKVFNDTLKDMDAKVIAINTLSGIEGKEKWTDVVNKNKLYNWINCWNPYSYQYKLTYDIRANPQIFILDDNKEIFAKRIGEDQVVEILEVHKKNRKKENKQ